MAANWQRKSALPPPTFAARSSAIRATGSWRNSRSRLSPSSLRSWERKNSAHNAGVIRSLRCSKRHAVPSVSGGGAIPDGYCSSSVNTGCGFQCLIGEIISREDFVNLIKIGGIVFHGNLRRFRDPYLVHFEGFGV